MTEPLLPRKFTKCALFSVLGLLIAACSPSRVVKPLDQGELRLGADLGGPAAENIPLPLSAISASYGLSDTLSLFGGLHTTTLAYQTLQLDLGATLGLLQSDGARPGLSVTGALDPILDLREFSFTLYPETNAYVYWDLNEKRHVYAGLMVLWDLQGARIDIGDASVFNPAVTLGHQVLRDRWTFGAELRWLNFTKELIIPQADVNSIAGLGSVGFYLNVGYRIPQGGIKE